MSEVKLYHGDCLEVMKDIADKSVDLILTDPPYFVIPNGKPDDKFCWDSFESEKDFENFTRSWFNLAFRKLKNDSFMFVFWSQKRLKLGFELFNPSRLLLWHYENLVIGGGGDFAYDYEPILMIRKGNPKIIKGKHSCIFNYTKPQSNFKSEKLFHPTQKPVALIEKIITLSLEEGDRIMDCFMGSGSTGVACVNTNRNFIGIEKDDKYFEIAKDRINKAQNEREYKLF